MRRSTTTTVTILTSLSARPHSDLMIGDDKKAKADLRNVFVADIVGIVVFYRAPPRVNSIIPRKRRIFAVHPSFPTKRRRARDE
ncbi:hypothetical protein PQX77_010623 [Marasmius sp. AFHP31]|nr:hypothetical protein PQX77_010623 [Marasmius sp. AFHP31]